MSNPARELHLGLTLWAQGTHPAGWRYAGSRGDAVFDIGFLQRLARLAESGKLDFVFLVDGPATGSEGSPADHARKARLEPFTVAASVAAVTSRIGIAVAANPGDYDPFTIARLTASLDHLSKGRASWDIAVDADGGESEERFGRTEEFIGVVKALWDSWDDGAFVRNSSTGQFIDRSKVHSVNHTGRHFSIAGPLNVARPPQGHVVTLHAGTSEASRDLAARDADVVLSRSPTISAARDYYADLKDRARRHGRSERDLVVLQAVAPIIAETTEAAVETYDRLNALLLLDPEDLAADGPLRQDRRARKRNLTLVSEIIGVDIRGRERDAAVPAAVWDSANGAGKALFAAVTEATRRDVVGTNRITYRDLIHAAIADAPIAVGTPGEVADHLAEWFGEGAADGFNILPAYVPGAVEAFVGLVVPLLQKRGIFRTDYAGPTFREHLSLRRPPSTFASDRASAS